MKLVRERSFDTGSYHELPSGRRIPLSLVNNTAPSFDLPETYRAASLPFGQSRGAGYDRNVAHFLGLCMKVVYEEPAVIEVNFLRLINCYCTPKSNR